MTFDVSADAYDRFMGRWSGPLAHQFADLANVQAGDRILDVGCGPGALTAVLVQRVGSAAVSAVDPSESFVTALRSRFPHVAVQRGAAEDLPFPDESFDAALAQLVVHFMHDPVAGLRDMRRVTREGGRVGACVWDHGGGSGPLSVFWRAAHDLDPSTPGEADLPGTRQGQLAELCKAVGFQRIEQAALTVQLRFESLDDWWDPFRLGVGPAGAYVDGLDETSREALRSRCAELLPAPPFELAAAAWAVIAHR